MGGKFLLPWYPVVGRVRLIRKIKFHGGTREKYNGSEKKRLDKRESGRYLGILDFSDAQLGGRV